MNKCTLIIKFHISIVISTRDFKGYKQRFNYDTAMSIYTSSTDGNAPEMRAWFVYRLGSRSVANGMDNLDFVSGRLVGLALEVLGALGKGCPMQK